MTLEFLVVPNKSKANIFNLLVIENEYNHIQILLDTGASIPTWVGLKNKFFASFPQAYLLKDTQSIIRGFGGSGEIAPVYVIPDFYLQDQKGNKICYKNLPIVLIERNYSFDIILSYTMINKMNFNNISYSNVNDNFKAKQPSIRLHPHKKIYYLGYTKRPTHLITNTNLKNRILTPYILDYTYVFTN